MSNFEQRFTSSVVGRRSAVGVHGSFRYDAKTIRKKTTKGQDSANDLATCERSTERSCERSTDPPNPNRKKTQGEKIITRTWRRCLLYDVEGLRRRCKFVISTLYSSRST